MCVDFHQGLGQTHSQSSPIPEGAEPGKPLFITMPIKEARRLIHTSIMMIIGEDRGDEDRRIDKISCRLPPPISHE